jgi:hypothetical protein
MRTIYSICNISHMLLCCIKKFKKLIGILLFLSLLQEYLKYYLAFVHGIKFFSKYLDAART